MPENKPNSRMLLTGVMGGLSPLVEGWIPPNLRRKAAFFTDPKEPGYIAAMLALVSAASDPVRHPKEHTLDRSLFQPIHDIFRHVLFISNSTSWPETIVRGTFVVVLHGGYITLHRFQGKWTVPLAIGAYELVNTIYDNVNIPENIAEWRKAYNETSKMYSHLSRGERFVNATTTFIKIAANSTLERYRTTRELIDQFYGPSYIKPAFATRSIRFADVMNEIHLRNGFVTCFKGSSRKYHRGALFETGLGFKTYKTPQTWNNLPYSIQTRRLNARFIRELFIHNCTNFTLKFLIIGGKIIKITLFLYSSYKTVKTLVFIFTKAKQIKPKQLIKKIKPKQFIKLKTSIIKNSMKNLSYKISNKFKQDKSPLVQFIPIY